MALGSMQQTPDEIKQVKNIFDAKRDASKDIWNALEIADKKSKHLLLHVGGNWCPWCRKFEHLLVENREISKLISEKFIVVHVNYSSDNENKEVLAKYPKVLGFPHFFVLDKAGKVLKSQVSEELEDVNQYNAEKVLAFLKKWAP